MSREPDEALEVLRGIWSAQGQTSADLEHSHGEVKACKRMASVGFDGIKGDDEDLRAAWRNTLQREGKLDSEGGSVKDLVFGSADPA
ncbi:MAG TPA: hypothetical protein VHY58_22300 [Streptosporangiaceae bacterium]|jgi:hypothetical protein|nr:hypothetical protein [Streptosporangiaceae bacterium]